MENSIIVENLSKLSVSEAAELSKLLEEKWGVEANAPIVAVAPQPSANGESQDEVGDGGVVNIELIAAGDKKIDVIKEVRVVDLIFDRTKCGKGVEELNRYLERGFEVFKQFQTESGLVIELARWGIKDE